MNLQNVRNRVIFRVNQAEYAIRIHMACACYVNTYSTHKGVHTHQSIYLSIYIYI